MLALQETPAPKTPALQGPPSAPHPIVQTLRPFRLVCGCSLAAALPGCTGSGLLPAEKEPGRARQTDAAVRRPDPVCPLVLLPPGSPPDSAPARAAVPLCTVSRRAPVGGVHRLRCARSQAPAARKDLLPSFLVGSAQVLTPTQPCSDRRVTVRGACLIHTHAHTRAHTPTHSFTSAG